MACAALLAVMVGGPIVRLATGSTSRATETWRVGGDFVEFYIAGRILNEGRGTDLYDLALQERLFVELLPGETSLRAPFLYPPFVAWLFRPLAMLSMSQALAVFMVVSPLLLIFGLTRLASRLGFHRPAERALVVVAGLSFFPYSGYTWLGAQISVIGFAAIAVAITEEDRGRGFASGLALSLCLYKPTLLILVAPMLILTRRYRQLAGFVAGGLVLMVVSVLVAGVQGSLGFVQKMLWMGSPSTLDSGIFNPHRYVDFASFFRLLLGGSSWLGWAALVLTTGGVAVFLVRGWLASARASRTERLQAWAPALTWTLVLNVYVPFYDCVLLLAPVILAVSAARGRLTRTSLVPLLVVLYVLPIFAEAVARSWRVQPYTLAIAAFGLWLGSGRRIGSESQQGVTLLS